MNNEKELEQITKQLDALSISDSDNSLYSKLTNYKQITTKQHDFLTVNIIDSLKLNNANLVLDNKMLRESLEKYKNFFYPSSQYYNDNIEFYKSLVLLLAQVLALLTAQRTIQ